MINRHKLQMSAGYKCATLNNNHILQKYQALTSVMPHCQSLKYQRSTMLGPKVISLSKL